MKPDNEVQDEESNNATLVSGDVIGDTAYSERFVLKILLKLANLDSLKHEISEKSFEDDLCTLWDMTAERDVVLFLQKHEVLKLIHFALPTIDSPRIVEILIGIIGNMCCQQEVVVALHKIDNFLTILLEYIKTDDSLILIQLLRLISSCIYLGNDNQVLNWINLFEDIGYADALYFILNNSSNKDLLITAIENFNTISSYGTEKSGINFFAHFAKPDALASLTTAFVELAVNQKDLCDTEELERIFVVSLQITLNLSGLDGSAEIYESSKPNIVEMIYIILNYYKTKLVDDKNIDTDLADIIDSTNTIADIFKLNESSEPEKYFGHSFDMWKFLLTASSEENEVSSFEDDKKLMKDFFHRMGKPLCTLMCNYLKSCSESNLQKVLDLIDTDYEDILKSVDNKEIEMAVSKKSTNYRTRLKENVDS